MYNKETYQIGSYVWLRGKYIVSIVALGVTLVRIRNMEGIETDMTYHDISPIEIEPKHLERLSFDLFRETEQFLHTEYLYEISFNNKLFYYLRGIKYKNGTLWYCNGLTIKYIHQLQNYFRLVNESYILKFDNTEKQLESYQRVAENY